MIASTLQMITVMKWMLFLSLLLLLGLLSEFVFSRTLQFDSCTVSVHTQELRRHYTEIRSQAISGDTEIGVMMLDRSTMTNIQSGQTCCYLRLLLRFYVEKVFRNFATSQPEELKRCSSALANAFVTVRRNINRCNCLCDEDTQRAIDSLNTEFDKLSINKAAQKAVAEMDTLLDWLDDLEGKTTVTDQPLT
ncbi:interleukin 19 like [Dunckerocampus dactyliophorus]|uniref:interleukin 19 like n=1 Tax=Dunckerocampus dactyliophorus TaxID=161453 RepID=UPI00240635B9|nr:interleukin 19 like [Dunckerocampus dactyliophorus]